jgi:hypothetical protein
MVIKNCEKYLSLFLWFIAIHSILVGIGLIFMPSSILAYFGLPDYSSNFFQAQGGTFHIAVSVAYCMAAANPNKSANLIWFIVYLKLIAFIFLMIYFLFVLQNWLILISGIGDGAMAGVLFFIFKLCKIDKSDENKSTE